MKYTSKKLPDSAVEVEVTLDHKDFLVFWQPIFNSALSGVSLKGFRPGTAPKEMAEKAIDKEKVFESAVSEAARDSLKKIMEENDWQFIDQPKIEVLEANSEKDLGLIPLSGTPDSAMRNLGLKFKATVSLFPEVRLGNYQKIAKKVFGDNKKEISVSDDEIKKSLDYVLNSRAKLTRISREAKKGDVVDIDFEGFADGKPLDGASGKADNFILGEGKFIPGFEDNIVGKKENEKIEFSINFPKDYWKEDLRNKKVDFKVTVKGVYNRELPELNDEFVKGLGKFENAEAFRKSVREGIQKEKEMKEKEKNQLKVIQEIIKDAKIELPKVMIEHTLEHMVEDFKRYSPKESETDLKKKLEERAKNNVLMNLVIHQIAKEQQLDPSHEEVESEASAALSRSGGKIDRAQLYDYVYGEMRNKKVFNYLETIK